MGTSSIVYASLADSTSTCSTLGLPALASSTSYHCASSSQYRNINGTGWIPIDFNKISAGSPFGSLPIDPTNQTSSGLYYTYSTNGTQYQLTALPESTKYKDQYIQNPQIPTYPGVITQGTSQSISPLFTITNLVGFWPLNEGSGTVAYDKSGDGNNGTWQGTASGTNSTYYTAGMHGEYAGYFNGSNDYVTTNGNVGAYTDNFSVVAWIKASTMPTNSVTTLMGNRYNSTSGWQIELDQGRLALRTFNGTQNYSSSGYSLSSGKWYQIGIVQGNGTVVFYVNGVAVANGTIANPAVGSQPFTIGYLGVGSGGYEWQGDISHVRLYHQALSAAQISALYDAEK